MNIEIKYSLLTVRMYGSQSDFKPIFKNINSFSKDVVLGSFSLTIITIELIFFVAISFGALFSVGVSE